MRLPGTNFEYGRPQFFATLLLLAYLAQTVGVAISHPRTPNEEALIEAGIRRVNISDWQTTVYFKSSPGALSEFFAALPVGLRNVAGLTDSVWLPRLPFVVLGMFLGGTVWWVARRLYGNAGGYIALALYSFTPLLVVTGGSANASIGMALGWFSVTFLAIGLAHNLDAAYRHWMFRSVLLVIALAGGVSLDGGVLLAMPLALFFMLYLSPHRRPAAIALWVTAFVASVTLSIAAGALIVRIFRPLEYTSVAVSSAASAPQLGWAIALLVVGASVAVFVFVSWPRTRYFGNWAPLLTATLLAILSVLMREAWQFGSTMTVFSIVFIAGICADLLETRYRRPVLIAIVAFLVLHAATGLHTVFRLISPS